MPVSDFKNALRDGIPAPFRGNYIKNHENMKGSGRTVAIFVISGCSGARLSLFKRRTPA
jgi:hypothetical protein